MWKLLICLLCPVVIRGNTDPFPAMLNDLVTEELPLTTGFNTPGQPENTQECGAQNVYCRNDDLCCIFEDSYRCCPYQDGACSGDTSVGTCCPAGYTNPSGYECVPAS